MLMTRLRNYSSSVGLLHLKDFENIHTHFQGFIDVISFSSDIVSEWGLANFY